jgi:hypothetical protein
MRSLSFAILIMILVYLSLSVMPDISTIGWKLIPPPPLVHSPADCPKLEGSLVYQCLINYALEEKNESLCAGIDNVFFRDRCYSEFYKGETSLSICEKMSGPETKADCFANLALASGDAEICRKATPESAQGEATDRCFLTYAIGSGKKETCENIANPERTSECLYYFASASRNPDDCVSKSNEAKNRCLMRLAVDSRNKNSCLLLDDEFRDVCLLQMAVISKDPSACGMIRKVELAEECLRQAQ